LPLHIRTDYLQSALARLAAFHFLSGGSLTPHHNLPIWKLSTDWIRTHNLSKRAAADLRRRPPCHWDLPIWYSLFQIKTQLSFKFI